MQESLEPTKINAQETGGIHTDISKIDHADKSHETEKEKVITEEEIQEAVAFFVRHPERVPAHIKIEFLKDFVQMSANDAMVSLTSDIAKVEDAHPEETFLAKLYVESWARSHGWRLIEDQKISDSIRRQKHQRKERKEQGLVKRILKDVLQSDAEAETELIMDNEDLVAENEGLRMENARLKADNEQISKTIEQTISNAAGEARQIVTQAHTESKRLEDEVRLRVEQLKREIEVLEAAKKEYLANPDMALLYEQKRKTEREQKAQEILNYVPIIEQEEKSVQSTFSQTVERFREVVDLIGIFEKEFGSDQRKFLVQQFITNYKQTVLSKIQPSRFDLEKLASYLELLTQKDISVAEVTRVFELTKNEGLGMASMAANDLEKASKNKERQ
jgi:hypothetical protein